MKFLLLIRHGESTWNVEHRLPGQLPGIELTEEGRAQAQRLASALKMLPLSSMISSPLTRALQTAEYLVQGRALTIQREPNLMDIDLGHWSGQNRDALFHSDPAWKAFVRDPLVAPADVETFPELEQRVVTAIERWLSQEATGPLPAFVTHADVIKLLLAHYLGLEAGRARSLSIDNASVSVVAVETDRLPLVLAMSWNPQPGWLHSFTPILGHANSEEKAAGEQNT